MSRLRPHLGIRGDDPELASYLWIEERARAHAPALK